MFIQLSINVSTERITFPLYLRSNGKGSPLKTYSPSIMFDIVRAASTLQDGFLSRKPIYHKIRFTYWKPYRASPSPSPYLNPTAYKFHSFDTTQYRFHCLKTMPGYRQSPGILVLLKPISEQTQSF